MYKRNLREEKDIENISNRRAAQAYEKTRSPTFESSMAGARLVSRLTTASRRKTRGLDTSLTPGPFSPPCGECAGVVSRETSKPKTKTGAAEVMVDADMGSLFRFRCVSWNGRMLLSDLLSSLPVHPSHQVNTVAFFQIVCG